MDEYLPATDSACHECDLLNRVPPLPPRQIAKCARCGAILYRNIPDSVERTLSLAVGSAILFIVPGIVVFARLKQDKGKEAPGSRGSRNHDG